MKTDVKTTCKYCEKPTIKTIPKRKKLKPDQKYYFTYYYKCTDYPKCRAYSMSKRLWYGRLTNALVVVVSISQDRRKDRLILANTDLSPSKINNS